MATITEGSRCVLACFPAVVLWSESSRIPRRSRRQLKIGNAYRENLVESEQPRPQIVVQGVNADGLPAWTPSLRVKLSDGCAERDPLLRCDRLRPRPFSEWTLDLWIAPPTKRRQVDGGAAPGLGAQPSHATVSSNNDKNAKGHKAVKKPVVKQPDFIASTEKGPPPIADTIRLAPGVSLREGGARLCSPSPSLLRKAFAVDQWLWPGSQVA